MDGYSHYIPVSHWWRVKTPFYNWYSKNFASILEPLCIKFEFGLGHATERQIKHTFVLVAVLV